MKTDFWKSWKFWAAVVAVLAVIVSLVLYFTVDEFKNVILFIAIGVGCLAIGFIIGYYIAKNKKQ